MSDLRGVFSGEPYVARKSESPNGVFVDVEIRGQRFRVGRLPERASRRTVRYLTAQWLRVNQMRWRIRNIARRWV